MGAILGRVSLDGKPISRSSFETAFSKVSHYGNVAGGTVLKDGFALGEQHFKIRDDIPYGKKPAHSGNLFVISDAILDNRCDFREHLNLTAGEVARLSNSELILRSYREFGAKCLEKLEGDFAFVVWDSQKKRLFLARDHIGSRPLFWRHDRSGVVFGTDIESIVSMDDLKWRLDRKVISDYLDWPLDPLNQTFFKGLEVCPPGGSVTVDPLGTKVCRWWFPQNYRVEKLNSAVDYSEKLRELVETSIKQRVHTDLKIGSHISGGIDSTTVSVLAHRELKRHGRELSRSYAWPPELNEKFPLLDEDDERPRIRALALREGFQVAWGGADGSTTMELANRPIEFEGLADLSDELPILRSASKDQIGIMLSGWGGDEGFSAPGFGLPSLLLKRMQLLSLFRLAKSANPKSDPSTQIAFVWNEAVCRCLPSWFPMSIEKRYTKVNPGRLLKIPNNSTIWRNGSRLILPANPNKYLCKLLLNGHLSTRMDTWAVWGAKSGLQYRYPLASRRIFEFMCNVPPQTYMHGGHSRFLARRAIKDLELGHLQKSDRSNEENRRAARRQFLDELCTEKKEAENKSPFDYFLEIPKPNVSESSEKSYSTTSLDSVDIVSFEAFVAYRVAAMLFRRRS